MEKDVAAAEAREEEATAAAEARARTGPRLPFFGVICTGPGVCGGTTSPPRCNCHPVVDVYKLEIGRGIRLSRYTMV